MTTNSPLRLIIAAGGTGGHVLPAVAVLRELRARGIPLEVKWIGGIDGIEAGAACDEKVAFAAIPTGKLRRYFDIRTVRDAINIPRGVVAARKLVRGFGPDVVFSTGGFVSVPTVMASRGVAPILTHEQTTIIGLANRINVWSADVVALSFSDSGDRYRTSRRKVLVTGNPIRSELLDGDPVRGRRRYGFTDDLPVVYVTGGARGASPLNMRVKSMLAGLLETAQVLHQTGPASANADWADLSAFKGALPVQLADRYVPTEFIQDGMADVYAMADVIVSRAGAGTIAELTALGKAAILIPLPLSGGGEQITNAKAMADRGGGIMLMQDDATPERLLYEIRDLLGDRTRREQMGSAAGQLGRLDAAARLADELIALAERRETTDSTPC